MKPSRAASVTLLAALGAARALAVPIELAGEPGTLSVTESASAAYHYDNGNVAPVGNPDYDPTGRGYTDWINRLDAQLSWRNWHAELRFDSALFLNTPAVQGSLSDPENSHLATLLENRYVDNLVLEKISVDYAGETLTATLGDSYLSYGRGLVVSLLKVDALGVDTTLRGANVTARFGGFSVNGAAGVTNTVNTDPATGEVAPDPMDYVTAARLEYRLPRVFTLGVDGAGFFANPATAALTTYLPPATAQNTAARPLAFPGLGSVLSQCDLGTDGVCRIARAPSLTDTANFSATLDLPHLGDFAKAYFELALQEQWIGASPLTSKPNQGGAFFGSVALFLGKATVTIEGKDYQSYVFPVQSGLSSRMFPAFWQQSVYNNPPNLEEQFQEPPLGQTIFGPRLRASYDVSPHLRPFASLAYFHDVVDQYDVYDGSAGVEASWQDGKSHARLAVGGRDAIFNHLAATQSGEPYQQELWIQFDVVQVLNDIYSVQLEGLHRRYGYDFLVRHPWSWGYAYLSLRRHQWSATVGYEYYTQDPIVWRKDNPNAGFAWSPNDHYTVRVFAGGREAGLRCINGICRVFPGFTGASAELVARY